MANRLISDFDGTMTKVDFYRLAIERVIPADCPDYWRAYRQGEITHFEALNAYFQSIRATPAEMSQLLQDMQLDSQLATSVKNLAQHGWWVVVTSAGCGWYIDRMLDEAGVQLEVHASPGTFDPASGLTMSLPTDSPFLCREQGIDKAAVVRHWLDRSAHVAFAGDGFPDVEAARLVAQEYRFARGDLAEQLRSEGLAFRSFKHWSEIADCLTGK